MVVLDFLAAAGKTAAAATAAAATAAAAAVDDDELDDGIDACSKEKFALVTSPAAPWRYAGTILEAATRAAFIW